jgi:hypothetical protein
MHKPGILLQGILYNACYEGDECSQHKALLDNRILLPKAFLGI